MGQVQGQEEKLREGYSAVHDVREDLFTAPREATSFISRTFALADFMLIDRVRKFVKYGSDSTNPQLLKVLERATAYEVSSLLAFMLHGVHKATLGDFLKSRGLISSDDTIEINLPKCVWMEYEKPEYGVHVGALLVPDGNEGGFVYETYRLTENGLERAAKAPDWESWYQYMLKLIQFFESNPETMTVTSIVQEPRPAKIKNGKEVKSPLKQVRTFIIDGVEKVYNPDTQAHEYVVHPRGWHNRLHDVIGHWRHIERSLTMCTCCSPPRTAIWISPFERGDETLGRVETEKRFRVSPADVFLHDLAAPKPKTKN